MNILISARNAAGLALVLSLLPLSLAQPAYSSSIADEGSAPMSSSCNSDTNSTAAELPPRVNAARPDSSSTAEGRFSVILQQQLDSKYAKPGDSVVARLGSPLKIGSELFLPGSTVVGHVTEVDHARCHLRAEVSPKRWLRADGALAVQFDEIESQTDGAQAPICATALPLTSEFRKTLSEKKIAVSKKGCVEVSRTSEIRPKLTRMALGAAAMTHSPIVPVVGGLIGAVAPSMVLESADRDYQKEVSHRRLKGFATGVAAGLPGGFLINDTMMKGRDAVIPPGTVLIMQMHNAAETAHG